MDKIKSLLLLVVIMIPLLAVAQKPGYQPYQCTGYVNNGQRSAGSGTVWVKFDGNHLFLDHGYYQSQYVYNGRQDNGNSLYYREVYNHGVYGQPSGWVEDRNQWLIITPDKTHFNTASNGGRDVAIYQLQSASSAGEMIY